MAINKICKMAATFVSVCVLLSLQPFGVRADSLYVTLEANASYCGEQEVKVILSTGSFSSPDGRLACLPAPFSLSYDEHVFSFLSWEAAEGTHFTSERTSEDGYSILKGPLFFDFPGIGENTPFLTILLQVKEGAPAGETEIRFQGEASGEDDKSNRAFVKYTGTSLTINQQPHSDNHLQTLSVDGIDLSPEFDPDIFQYTGQVPYDVTAVNIRTQVATTATILLPDNASDLQPGNNQLTVRVTAENGTSQDYIISLYRELPSSETTDTVPSFTSQSDLPTTASSFSSKHDKLPETDAHDKQPETDAHDKLPETDAHDKQPETDQVSPFPWILLPLLPLLLVGIVIPVLLLSKKEPSSVSDDSE